MRISFIRIVSLLIVALFLAACSSGAPESQLSEISKLLSKNYPMTQEQMRDITAFTDAGKKLMQVVGWLGWPLGWGRATLSN